jgi:ERCC4-type nuclease
MFSSEQAVMQASREDLQTIEGIGEKTSNRIRWAISDKDGTLRR